PAPSLSSLSIGQVVTVLGLATIPDTATYFIPTAFDATGSTLPGAQLRIQNTPLVAQFNSANSANDMLVKLATVNNAEPTFLNLNSAATGNPAANPASYDIATATDISATAPGTYLKVDGMMTAFGQGPPYFNASSVSNAVQQLVIQWNGNGSTN